MILDEYSQFFEDNDFYQQYRQLIIKNISNKYEKFKTQRHHIIPKSYLKRNNLPLNNTKENIVCLQFKDHLLAHIYLFKCTKDIKLKGCNLLALTRLLGLKYLYPEELPDVVQKLDYLQELYEKNKQFVGELRKGRVSPKKGKHLTEETKELIRKANLGKKYSEDVLKKRSQSLMGHPTSDETKLKISKALKGRSRKPLSEEHKTKISNSLKGNKRSQSTKDKIGNSNRGRIQVHKDGVIKCIHPEEFQYYESLGFCRGRK